MKEKGFKQVDLAELMGVSLDRVKSLTSGKTKNLKQEEAQALVKKLHIRGDWLATGEGPMFQDETERLLHQRLDQLSSVTNKVLATDLHEDQQRELQLILFALETNDSETLKKALSSLSKAGISQREAALLNNYRACKEVDQKAIERVALNAAAAKQEVTPKGKRVTGKR